MDNGQCVGSLHCSSRNRTSHIFDLFLILHSCKCLSSYAATTKRRWIMKFVNLYWDSQNTSPSPWVDDIIQPTLLPVTWTINNLSKTWSRMLDQAYFLTPSPLKKMSNNQLVFLLSASFFLIIHLFVLWYHLFTMLYKYETDAYLYSILNKTMNKK